MGLIKLTAGRNAIKQCYLSNYPRAELQAGSSSSIAELSAGQLFSPPSRFQDLTQNQAIPVGKQEQNPTFSFLKTYSHAKMGGISPVLMNFWLWCETFRLHAHCFVTIPAGMDVKMPKRVIFETYRMLKDGCAREMNEASEAMHKPMLRWDLHDPTFPARWTPGNRGKSLEPCNGTETQVGALCSWAASTSSEILHFQGSNCSHPA